VTSREKIELFRSKKPADKLRETDKTYVYAGMEPGIIHPTTGSTLRLRDNGNIEIFAKDYSGLVLSAEGKSALMFADRISMNSKEFRINSDDTGFLWNYKVFNPDMTKVELLIVDENMRIALQKLLTGGIPVQVGPLTGVSLPASGGIVRTIKPFPYDKTPQLVSKAVATLSKKLAKGEMK
jgi:hypothetical protein